MKKHIYHFVILTLTLVSLTVVFNLPVFLHPSQNILGQYAGDNIRTVNGFWWYRYAAKNGYDYNKNMLINYPSGINQSKGIVYPLWNFTIHNLLKHWNEVLVFNFLILTSFLLAGISMFYLVFYITRNFISSLLSAIIFSFSAYHFSHVWVQLTLAHIEWFPLLFLAFLVFRKRMNYKSALFFSLAVLLVIANDYYYTYIGLIGIMIAFSYILIRKRRYPFRFSAWPAFMSLSIILIAGFFLTSSVWQTIFSHNGNILSKQCVVRPFKNLLELSAYPFNYILPNLWHPIFGKFTRLFFDTHLYGGNDVEQGSLYLGLSVLLLCFLGLRKHNADKNMRFHSNLFITIAIGAIIFSFPPYWNLKLFKIYFPSFFMYKIFPMFRAYTRFGVLAVMSVSVLAGISLYNILKNKNRNRRNILTGIILVVILFDFLNFPPYHYRDVSRVPAVYEWLMLQKGKFAIAEYPLGDINDTTTANYRLWQRVHKKPLINGAPPLKNYLPYKIMGVIENLGYPETPEILKKMGAVYVIVHRAEYKRRELFLPDISKLPGLKFVHKFSQDYVYRIAAKPKAVNFGNFKKWRNNQVKKMTYFNGATDIPEIKSINFSPGIYKFRIRYLGFIPLGELLINLSANFVYENNNVYRISAEVILPKWLNFVLNARFNSISYVDKRKFYTYRYEEKYSFLKHKGGKIVYYNQDSHIMNAHGEKIAILPFTQDPLSLFLFLPAIHLGINKISKFNLNTGGRNYLLEVEAKKENNKILLIDCKIEKRRKHARIRMHFIIGINKNKNMIPRYIEILGPIGSAKIILEDNN